MAVRVKIRVEKGGKNIETAALVNTGFETGTSQLLLPEAASRRLGISLDEARKKEYLSAGGPVRLYLCRSPAKVQVIGKAESSKVDADVVTSPYEEEVLIGDRLIGELGIVLKDIATGTWRLRGESEVHESEEPQSW